MHDPTPVFNFLHATGQLFGFAMHITLDAALANWIAPHLTVAAALLLCAALIYSMVFALLPSNGRALLAKAPAQPDNLRLEEYQSSLAEALPGALCTYRQNLDGTSQLIFASANFEEVCGIAPNTAWQGAQGCFQRVYSADIPKLREAISAAARAQKHLQAEYRIDHPVKGEVWIEELSTPKLQPDGTQLWHGVIFDITERKRSEQNVSLSQQRLAIAIDAAKLGVFDHDLRRRKIFVSDRFREIGGWPPAMELSRDQMIASVHPEDRERVDREMHAAHDRGGSGYLLTKYRVVRPDGSERWVVSRSATVFEQSDGELKATRIIGCVLDVTENKQVEDVASRWLTLFEASGFGLAQIRASDDTFLSVNRTFAEQRGYRPDELEGNPIWILYPADRWSSAAEQLKAVDSNGHTVYETVHVRKDGTSFPVLMEMTVLKNNDGSPTTRIAYALDISQLHHARSALIETQRLHITTVSTLREGVMAFSKDGRVLSCNPSAERILGISFADLVAKKATFPAWSALREDGSQFPPDEFPVVRALATGQPCEGVVMGVVKPSSDGDASNPENIVWILVNAAPVLDPQSEYCGSAVVSIIDISARKNAERLQAQLLATLAASEKETQRQRNLFKSIFEGAPDAMIETDLKRVIRSVNPGVQRIFGYEPSELIGQPTRRLYATQSDWETVGLHLEACQRKDIMKAEEVDFSRKNGEVFPGVISGAILKDENQRPVGYIAVVRDIKLERERDKALEESKRLESLGRLTAGIAHDFNNLLTVISVNLQLIDMSVHTRDMKRKVQAALLATNMGAKLNQRLTGMAHKRRLNATPLNLNSVIRGLYDILRVGLGERSTLNLSLACDLRLTNVDSSEVENMLINLTINSRDAMPEGGLLNIVTSNVDIDDAKDGRPPPGRYVMLSVRDTGSGMTPDVLAQATEPFYTTKDSGSGLGLAAVSDFVKQSQGHMTLLSAEGEGTTVIIHLPIYENENFAPSDDTRSAGPSHKQRLRILVVEDNQAVLEAVTAYLRSLGYSVLTATDATEALEAVTDHDDIDLVFTDIVLPGGGSGQDLARTIANSRPHIKVLFTSGYAEDEPDGDNLAKDILKKPYPLDELQRVIADTFAKP